MFPIKFDFDWPSGLEEKIFGYYDYIHVNGVKKVRSAQKLFS